jgi:hypothetical protein
MCSRYQCQCGKWEAISSLTVSLTFTTKLCALEPLSTSDRPQIIDPFTQTFITANIQLVNVSDDATMTGVELTFPNSGTIRAVGLNARSALELEEPIPPNRSASLQVKLAVYGKIKPGIVMHSELAYAKKVSGLLGCQTVEYLSVYLVYGWYHFLSSS